MLTKDKREKLKEKLRDTFNLIKESGFSALPSPKERLPADYPEQMRNLQNPEKRGVQIGDEEACLRTLHDVTYYRLKGYLLSLPNGVELETALNIHEFDNQMRAILLYALSKIEIHLRAQFSFFHVFKCGAYGYLDASNYLNPEHNHKKFLTIIEKGIQENADIPLVEHYLDKHNGVMPFWAMSELMSFGQWYYLYVGMGEEKQREFLQQLYGIRGKVAEIKKAPSLTAEQKEALLKFDMAAESGRFAGWLGCCKTLRNVCAHCGRLYDIKFPWNPFIPWIQAKSKKRKRARELNGQGLHRTLFGGILSVKFLYPNAKEWNEEVFPKIKSLLNSYGVDRNLIGFPPDWKTG